jgi:DNA polymerase-1
MALVFDIETNGFWPECNTIWMLCTEDSVTGEQNTYTDHDSRYPPLSEGLKALTEAKVLAGHNICGYDIPVLIALTGWVPRPDQHLYDTWVLSQLLRYKRPHKHGLEGWGGFFDYPKTKFDKFDKYSEEMVEYCQRDVSLNVKVYNHLVEEIKSTLKINPLFSKGMMVENQFALIEADIRFHGWTFDENKARELANQIEKRMVEIEDFIEPMIGLICLKVDKKDETKKALIKKDGTYAVSTCKYWGIEPEDALRDDRRILEPDADYSRVEFVQGRISSDRVLKSWLYKLGWEPDDWNVERINGKFVQKSPKLTESSLEPLGAVGKLISEYNSIANRYGILKGWLQAIEYDGRLHGKMWTIGTPSFRCRHEVIANLPTVDSVYGTEMRSLLLPRPGWVIVGSDSAGNQMRGLCHYIGNDEFTNEVIHGDVHTRNAETLSEFTGEPNRKKAKPFLYAFLFGGGAGKLASILVGVKDNDLGKRAIAKFENSIPGLGGLRDNLKKQFEKTKERFGEDFAFIRGIDGRIIFVKSAHQVLNYLLQTLEAITCKAAAVYFKKKADEMGAEYKFLLHYHDEFAIECPPEWAERLAELAKESFREAPKWFGVTCMDGDAKIGNNYAEVH